MPQGAGPRIALLLPSLNGGGAERVALFMAQTLAQAGYAVEVPVAVMAGSLVDHPLARRFCVGLGAPNEMLAAPHIARYCRTTRPDLLIAFVHSAKIMAGMARLIARDMPLALSVHCALDVPRGDRFWLRRWGYGLERWLYRGVLGAHAVCDDLAAQVVGQFAIPAGRVHSVYNAIPERGAPTAMPAEHAAWFDRPVIMTAGRLVAQKNHAALIDAFAASGLCGKARVLILGEGPLEGALRRQASALGVADSVIFGGFQPDVRPYMAASAGFVLSSRFEGFALVLAEALAAGCPVASVQCPVGPREVLADGALGRLLAPGDVGAMAAAMADMVSGALAPAAPDAVAASLARFAPDVVAAGYLRFVAACLANRRL